MIFPADSALDVPLDIRRLVVIMNNYCFRPLICDPCRPLVYGLRLAAAMRDFHRAPERDVIVTTGYLSFTDRLLNAISLRRHAVTRRNVYYFKANIPISDIYVDPGNEKKMINTWHQIAGMAFLQK